MPVAGVDAAHRDGRQLGAGGDQRPLQDLQAGRAAGAHDQPGGDRAAGDDQHVGPGRLIVSVTSASLHRGQDLDPRAVGERRAPPTAPRDDLAVHRHGHAGPRQRPARRARRARRASGAQLARASPLIQTTTRYLLGAAGTRPMPRTAGDDGPGARPTAGRRAAGPATASAVTGASSTPLRWWPVATSRPSGPSAPISGRLSGLPGPQPGRRSRPARTRRSRAGPLGVAQQVVHPAGGDRGVQADLGLGGADHQLAVGARHQVDGPPSTSARTVRAGRRERAGPQRAAAGSRPSPAGPARAAPGAARPSARPRRRGRCRPRARSPSAQRTPTTRVAVVRARPPRRSRRTPPRPARPRPAAPRAGPGCRRPGRRAPTARRAPPGRAPAPACAARGRSAARPAGPAGRGARRGCRARRGRRSRWRRRSCRPCAARRAGRRPRRARRRTRASGRRDSRPSASSSSSPGHASVTGASMPPATQEAPDAGAGSRTVTRRPCCAARQAQLSPMTPAPSTSSSDALCPPSRSLRRHDPDQVRRSGSADPLSARGGLPCVTCGAPYAARCSADRAVALHRSGPRRAADSDARLAACRLDRLAPRAAASTSAPTPAATAATSPSSPTPRSPAASTSSSCATRAPTARSRRATSWPRSRCSREACARHGALLAVNDRADVALAVGRRRAAPRPGRPAGRVGAQGRRRRGGHRTLRAQRRRDRGGRGRAGRRLLLRGPLLADARPSRAARPRGWTWSAPWRGRGAGAAVVRDRRDRRRPARRGAGGRRRAGRRRPGDHRGGRPARRGRGAGRAAAAPDAAPTG